MFNFLRPKDELSDADRARNSAFMMRQIFASSGADGFVSGGFLAAFALLIGASNLHIGIMTAIPFIMQPLQLFSVVLIERIRVRKPLALVAYLLNFAAWVPIALMPFVLQVPSAGAVALLLGFIAIRGAANALFVSSWNSWLRDLVPAGSAGDYFAQRLRIATIAAVITGLAAAVFADWWKSISTPDNAVFGYSIAFLFGSIVLGFSAVGLLSRVIEPRMPAPSSGTGSLVAGLLGPIRDDNFRGFVNFLFVWNFVVNLATPFFAVYMITRLGFPLTLVVGLGVVSQVMNILFLRVWGNMVDVFSGKTVLSVCSSLYFLVIIAWTFSTLPERHGGTIPLLILLHALLGVATAGVNIATATLRMKLSPGPQATSYLAVASLAASIGAGISPLLGGIFADYFAIRSFRISAEWIDPNRIIDLPAFSLTGFDFLFAVAFALGFVALSLLSRVREEGEATTEAVLDELRAQTRDNLRSLNSVRGLNYVAQFPAEGIRHLPKVPGLDIAIGVTAFQISATTKSMIDNIAKGGATARQLQTTASESVQQIIHDTRDVGSQGFQVAFGATHGAIMSLTEIGLDTSRHIEAAVEGTIRALGSSEANPIDVLSGAASGILQGASESGISIENARKSVIEIARASAEELGLTQTEAVEIARQAMRNADSELKNDQTRDRPSA